MLHPVLDAKGKCRGLLRIALTAIAYPDEILWSVPDRMAGLGVGVIPRRRPAVNSDLVASGHAPDQIHANV